MPSLILIDGGIGQLHAAAAALESLQIINQPLASIAKKEEILYIYGQENDPCILDRHSPVLHLIQQIRDETHRFAVTFHRERRGKRQTQTALSEVPGVGPRTAQKLLREFGSVANIQRAGIEKISAIVPRKSAEKIFAHLEASQCIQFLEAPKAREAAHANNRTEQHIPVSACCTSINPVLRFSSEVAMADNVGSKVSYFLVGLGVGALVGVLFAPKSGEDTREYLVEESG